MEDTILVIGWDSFGIQHVVAEFIENGYVVDFFDFPYKKENAQFNPKLGEKLVNKLAKNNYTFVFSFNFFPVISVACNACYVKYVSWIYDSPQSLLYSRTIYDSYNYVFIFDKAVYEDLKIRGADTVYYLPLAAPVDKYDIIKPTEDEKKEYAGEVVFIGSTYSEKEHKDVYWEDDKLSDFALGYIDGIIQMQKSIYGKIIMDKVLEPVLSELISIYPIVLPRDNMQIAEWYYSRFTLARKITSLERKEILQILGERHQVHLYTHRATPEFKNVDNKGFADFTDKAIRIFKCAKINLNITLKSIETGIPLRVMDIMGSGGFVISNYQADILEHFIPDEDIVLYTDYKDLLRKVDYYLTHEKERKQIARNGYEKVKKYHTYKRRIEEIFDIIGV